MNGKKIVGGLFCALFLVAGVVSLGLQGAMQETVTTAILSETEENDATKEQLQLYATSAVLMDADTGRVLYGKAENEPLAMASTTKIMTCILVLENVEDLTEKVKVSSYASSMPKVKLYIKEGEEYPVRELLFSLMLESHNDSAVALAEYVGKQYLSEELKNKDTAEFTREESKQAVAAFAKLMNEKAAELGCEDTWFITPNGLDATETVTLEDGTTEERAHHTTAAELAKIMSYCIQESPKRDVFLEITGTPSYSFVENGRSFTCNNHNAFLSMMDGALSGKTGFTNKAGYCYVGALERDDRTFVVALLACGWPNNKTYKWSDTRELMEYGMEHYFKRSLTGGKEQIYEKNMKPILVDGGRTDTLGEKAYVEVRKKEGGRGMEELLLREEEEITVKMDLKRKLDAPVKEGTVVGNIYYALDGVIYRIEDIVTAGSVEKISPGWCVEQILQRYLL